MSDIILESLQELNHLDALDEAALVYPRLKFEDLLDLYDYLYDHGFSSNLTSNHTAIIPQASLDRFDDEKKQKIMNLNLPIEVRYNGLQELHRMKRHLYWFLKFNADGTKASLTFSEMHNARDLEKVKEGISEFLHSKNISEEEINNLLDLINMDSRAVKGKYGGDRWDSSKNKLTLWFKVADPKNVPIDFLKMV